MPVSRTLKWSMSPLLSLDSQATSTVTSPRSVNLMALPTRLTMICRSLVGSPISVSGTSGCTSQLSSIPFSSARVAKTFNVVSRLLRRLKSMDSNSSLPASILEKSRISLIRVSKESAEIFTMVRYSRCSELSSVSRARSVMPMIPFMGVRSSWLMLARNSLLARLAASAADLAF